MSTPQPDSQNLNAAEPALLSVRAVRKRYHGHEVLRGVSVDVHRGEVLCVMGPSGSGKSTLLRCINHLETIESGRIWFDGALVGFHEQPNGRLTRMSASEIRSQRSAMGTVFQNFNLFQNLTVAQNITLAPVLVHGDSKADATREAERLLKQVGLEGYGSKYPRTLSGGQQQRVAIARAVAMRPKLMLFDEPTSALDPELVGEVLDVMTRLAASGMTMVVVTHEVAFAERVSDRIMMMESGQVIEIASTKDIFEGRGNARTLQFLKGTLGAREPSTLTVASVAETSSQPVSNTGRPE